MSSGAQYNIDPRLFVSLAGAETSFGNNITAGQFNAFNVLYNGLNSPFASFQSAINSVGHSLTNPRNGYDLTNTATMYGHYCCGQVFNRCPESKHVYETAGTNKSRCIIHALRGER